jgi:Ca-activated chloride channel homolog
MESKQAQGVVDQSNAGASGELEEIITTGSRLGNGNRSAAGHKSMAGVPARGGEGLMGQKVAANALAAPPAPPSAAIEGRDKFEHFDLNSVKQVSDEPVSTFSADVDTSSYSFVRKQLMQGVLPQKDAVRAEEMINYFEYSWPAAESRDKPFRPTVVVSDSPWGKGRKLIHIGIKGYELPARERPDANLVLLLDVSGSMDEPDKLPLVKESMKLLLGSLKRTDTVAIVVYAGAAGLVLPPTPVGEKEKIVEALDSLTPGGSTAGAEGIELAYQLAEKSFRKEGVNRILLCTDGDFNVGIDATNELKGFVERKRATGIFLSVLGFGEGNYRDELAQALAQNGNGVAAYIDTLNEARKVLVQEAGASLFTIAKDVKLQVEFNPATVAEYRLVGYETRALKREDFNNDAVDAGDVGAGHSVTAIYEITPVGVNARMVDESRYTKKPAPAATGTANEYGFLKIRYKLPSESKSQLIDEPISIDSGKVPENIRRDVEFSTAVAGFAQLLRGGQFTGSLSYEDVMKQAQAARGEDPYGYRAEFVQLAHKAQSARGMR